MAAMLTVDQRWSSEPEPELGLGSVTAFDEHMITVRFAATGESRTYTREQAPLRRVRFHATDRITTRAGERLTVTEASERN